MIGRLSGKSPVTGGLHRAAILILYRSDETMINGVFLTDLETHKAIEGKEHQWLKDVVPAYFPEVCCVEQATSVMRA